MKAITVPNYYADDIAEVEALRVAERLERAQCGRMNPGDAAYCLAAAESCLARALDAEGHYEAARAVREGRAVVAV
jgi:hypothetical protein